MEYCGRVCSSTWRSLTCPACPHTLSVTANTPRLFHRPCPCLSSKPTPPPPPCSAPPPPCASAMAQPISTRQGMGRAWEGERSGEEEEEARGLLSVGRQWCSAAQSSSSEERASAASPAAQPPRKPRPLQRLLHVTHRLNHTPHCHHPHLPPLPSTTAHLRPDGKPHAGSCDVDGRLEVPVVGGRVSGGGAGVRGGRHGHCPEREGGISVTVTVTVADTQSSRSGGGGGRREQREEGEGESVRGPRQWEEQGSKGR